MSRRPHTHGWPDERPGFGEKPSRALAWIGRQVLIIGGWAGIWVLSRWLLGPVDPVLFVPLFAAYLLGYVWRATG